MLTERWRKAIRAENLSELTERFDLYTARCWANWLAEQGYDIEPAEVRAYHVDEFIADWIEITSPANGAHRYRNWRVFLGWRSSEIRRRLLPGSLRSNRRAIAYCWRRGGRLINVRLVSALPRSVR
jgi:hypothetical protein